MNSLAPILPEIFVLAIGIIILILEPFWKAEDRRGLGWLTAGGLLLTVIVSLLFARPAEPISVLGGMLRFDWLGFFFKMIFLVGAAVTALFLMDVDKLNRRGEAYVLLLASVLGMNLMAASANLVMLYLAIETTSIPLYVLAGFLRTDDKSTEAGFKYLLFGALTSTVMLYGFSLLYGFTGTTDIYALASSLPKRTLPRRGLPAHRGTRLQGLGGSVPLLGAGCVRGRAHSRDGIPVHGLEGRGLLRSVAFVRGRLPARRGELVSDFCSALPR